MAIIKLTYTEGNEESNFDIYINSNYIVQMWRGYQECYTELIVDHNTIGELWVTETPEQILNLIYGLELSKQKA